MADQIEIAPLRGLDDFILESARFQIPNYKDPDKWANRVFNNLLYYQTNYFLMSVVVFSAVGLIHPTKMLCGVLAMVAAFGLFCYVTNTKQTATKFKREHPIISLLVIFTVGYFIVYMLSSVLVFLLGIMLPISLMFIHASFRLRNLKNKVTNTMESITCRKTPMGHFLEALGYEFDVTAIKIKEKLTRFHLQ